MKVFIQFGLADTDGAHLSELLGFTSQQLEVEASTARQVFEYLRSQSDTARELIQLRFSPVGLLGGGWMAMVNRGTSDSRYIKSAADLDTPLQEGDCIHLTSASMGG